MPAVSYFHALPPTMLLFTAVLGTSPLFFQAVIAEVCHQRGLSGTDCDNADVSSAASLLVAANSFCLTLPTIIMSGPFASFANHYGRKAAMASSLFGVSCMIGSYAYISLVHVESFYMITAAGSIICGLCGGVASYVLGVFSYVADCTVDIPSQRKFIYTTAELSIFLPKVASPVVMGLLATSWGYGVPLLTALALTLGALLWVVLIPESLPVDAECRHKPLSLSPFATFSNVMYIFRHGKPHVDSAIPYLSVAFCLCHCCLVGFMPVLVLYVERSFGWGPSLIGSFDGLEGGIQVFSMLCVPTIVRWITGRDLPLISWLQIGYFVRTIVFIGMVLVRRTVLLFALLIFMLPGGLLGPYTRTILSNSAPSYMQAQVFAGFAAMEGLASMVAPIFTVGYSVTTSAGYPQAMFAVMAACTTVSFIIASFVWYYDIGGIESVEAGLGTADLDADSSVCLTGIPSPDGMLELPSGSLEEALGLVRMYSLDNVSPDNRNDELTPRSFDRSRTHLLVSKFPEYYSATGSKTDG